MSLNSMKFPFAIFLLVVGSIHSFGDSLQQRVVDLQLERIALQSTAPDENTPSIRDVNAELTLLLKKPFAVDANYYRILKKRLFLLTACLARIEAAGDGVTSPRDIVIRNEIKFINEQLNTA